MGVHRVPPGDAIAAFSDAMRQRGLIPPDALITGRIQIYAAIGKTLKAAEAEGLLESNR